MVNEVIIAQPDPARTMEGLRDTGYEFNTAVADLVDNSIAAHATVVDIQLLQDAHGEITFAIADNGDGMDKEGLVSAMQYGSPKRSDPASLGKFGLGLKTASTAYCRRLSVISRNTATAPLYMATWDLDHVSSKKAWELLVTDEPDEEAAEHLEAVAAGHSGTVVRWTKVDRLFNKQMAGAQARRNLEKRKTALMEHVGLVYQRFLDHKDDRAPNVTIRLNGKAIEPWDPFQIGYSQNMGHERIAPEEGSKAEFILNAYVLPRKEDFPSEAAAKAARIETQRQGIYVYRQNRLIHDADWLDMFSIEPHLNLLRVELSFTHELDEFLHLDIKKSQIILAEELWTFIRDQFLTAPRREANKIYRDGERKAISKASKGAHDVSNRSIGTKEAEVGGAEVNVMNPNTGEVTVINSKGKFSLRLPVGSATRPGEVFVQPSDAVTDGLLFEPCILEGHKAVRINTGHEYYRKVYVPNLKKSVTVQGMDSLMWALAVAEYSTTSDKLAETFGSMRFEVSRILRKLCEDLPDPEVEAEPDVA